MQPIYYCKTCRKEVSAKDYQVGHKCMCGAQLIVLDKKNNGGHNGEEDKT